MRFEVGGGVAGKVALCAHVRFLTAVNEGMGLQSASLSEGLVALWAVVFDPTVGLFVIEKADPTCKCLRTHVTG